MENTWSCEGDKWIKAADALGSRADLISSITKAILADYKSFDSSSGGTVSTAWIDGKVNNYEFAKMDQDVRKALSELFEAEGVKVA